MVQKYSSLLWHFYALEQEIYYRQEMCSEPTHELNQAWLQIVSESFSTTHRTNRREATEINEVQHTRKN